MVESVRSRANTSGRGWKGGGDCYGEAEPQNSEADGANFLTMFMIGVLRLIEQSGHF
jgi:hypothetical protein